MGHDPDAYSLLSPKDITMAYKAAEELSEDYLEFLCRSVSREVERKLGRQFIQRVYTREEYDGTDTCYLRLNHPPISSITEVRLYEVAQTATDFIIADPNNGLIYYAGGFVVSPLWNRSMESGIADAAEDTSDVLIASTYQESGASQIWQFSYTGGYSTDDYRTKCADLIDACIELAIQKIEMRGKSGYQSETIGQYSYQLQQSANNFGGRTLSTGPWATIMGFKLKSGIR